jgi:hypothetical protein
MGAASCSRGRPTHPRHHPSSRLTIIVKADCSPPRRSSCAPAAAALLRQDLSRAAWLCASGAARCRRPSMRGRARRPPATLSGLAFARHPPGAAWASGSASVWVAGGGGAEASMRGAGWHGFFCKPCDALESVRLVAERRPWLWPNSLLRLVGSQLFPKCAGCGGSTAVSTSATWSALGGVGDGGPAVSVSGDSLWLIGRCSWR